MLAKTRALEALKLITHRPFEAKILLQDAAVLAAKESHEAWRAKWRDTPKWQGNFRTTELTPRQFLLCLLIRKFHQETGQSPTLRELSTVIGISKETIKHALDRIEKKGFLLREKGKRRAITLLNNDV